IQAKDTAQRAAPRVVPTTTTTSAVEVLLRRSRTKAPRRTVAEFMIGCPSAEVADVARGATSSLADGLAYTHRTILRPLHAPFCCELADCSGGSRACGTAAPIPAFPRKRGKEKS